MHIAFLTPEYPHAQVAHAAGIGTSIKNLAEALAAKKQQVTVFVYGQEKDFIIHENEITIHVIKHKKFIFFNWFFYRKHLQNYINKIVITNKIDAIEAPDWTGILAFMKFKIPLITRFHGSDAYFCYLENRKQKLKNYWFEKLSLQNSNLFVAPTNFAGQLTQKIFDLDKNKIQTIHNGIDLNQFQNPNPENFQEGLIVYIGTIIRKKGVLELPEIFRLVLEKHPTAKLLLIGGDSRDLETKSESTWQILQQTMETKILNNVNYLGKLPYSEIQSHIMKANVCVFPTFAETLGMVTIEAMAMQKAVITSDFGWTNELIVNSESGFLVNPKQHINFANAILNVLNNKQLAVSVGVNARKRVEDLFDINKIVIQNIDFYQSVINKQ